MAKMTVIACMLVLACHQVAQVASQEELSAFDQVRKSAVDLSLSHRDDYGNDRPVGRPFGFYGADVKGKGRRNFNANYGAGVGSVVYRSKNGRHSVGVGATVNQNRGRYGGFNYRSKPSYGVGLGYKYRFG